MIREAKMVQETEVHADLIERDFDSLAPLGLKIKHLRNVKPLFSNFNSQKNRKGQNEWNYFRPKAARKGAQNGARRHKGYPWAGVRTGQKSGRKNEEKEEEEKEEESTMEGRKKGLCLKSGQTRRRWKRWTARKGKSRTGRGGRKGGSIITRVW